ncbi:MAG: hypothetical protein MUE40_03535 [Anaerolineae bacterium]|nr:hypothetical protein [Anaerolineae bacterium]
MLALLPLLTLLALIALLAHTTASRRGGLLRALIVWGVLLAACTEILSLFRALTPAAVTIVWALALLVVLALLRQAGVRLRWPVFPRLGGTLAVLLALLLLVGLIGMVALVAAPNTWDSMAYHLPRVFFWEQFHSVAPYPTHTNRQLYQPPLAEFVMLHLQLLSGSDALANVGQPAALAFSAVGVSYLAAQFGAAAHGQLLAAALALTLPIGIMQATGSKNDVLVGLWVVCLAALLMEAVPRPPAPAHWCWLSAAAGLALFTKGTAYVYLAPLLLWAALLIVWRSRAAVGRAVVPLLLLSLPALMVNAGHFGRNLSVYGTPLTAPSHAVYYANELFSPAVLISNTLRNVALHLSLPDQLNARLDVSGGITRAIVAVHQVIGLDVNDPRTTFPWNEFELPPIWQMFNEDRAGNPLHLLLLALALLLYPLRRRAQSRPLTLYLLALLAQFALFSLLLKWQVWGTRLQLPFFIAAAPFVAVVLAAWLPRRLALLLALALAALALLWVFNTSTRPVFASTDRHPLALGFYIGSDTIQYESIFTQPRLAQYFNARSELLPPSQAAAAALRPLACARVGLISDESGLLYPLMMLLKADTPGIVMQHVGVTNETAFLAQQPPYRAFAPCAIVFMNGAQPRLPDTAIIDGRPYRRVWQNEAYELLTPVSQP